MDRERELGVLRYNADVDVLGTAFPERGTWPRSMFSAAKVCSIFCIRRQHTALKFESSFIYRIKNLLLGEKIWFRGDYIFHKIRCRSVGLTDTHTHHICKYCTHLYSH